MRQRVFSGSLLVLAASAMAFSATSNTCSSEVFSAAVVDSVKDQLEGFVAAPEISKRMALTSSSNLLQANSKMWEIAIDKTSQTVSEGAELSSSEMVAQNSGESGSLCFVVRRPG
jgi:hypothetical protein